jgi:hypothetical protein
MFLRKNEYKHIKDRLINDISITFDDRAERTIGIL